MVVLDDYPDIEAALVQLLPNAVDDLTADGVTPADFTGKLPFARVVCHGGSDDGITDTSRVTIDYFAATRALAQSGSEAVRQYLTQLGGLQIGSVVIDQITTDSKPQNIPWNDSNSPQRFVASYKPTARR